MSEPTTAAGRAYVEEAEAIIRDYGSLHWSPLGDVLAIEAEARAALRAELRAAASNVQRYTLTDDETGDYMELDPIGRYAIVRDFLALLADPQP